MINGPDFPAVIAILYLSIIGAEAIIIILLVFLNAILRRNKSVE